MEPRAFKDAVFEQFSRAAAAFASPKRLEIIDLLSQGDRTVDSIATATSMTVGNTSRHLQILRGAGMLEARRDGLHVVYRIADPAVIDGYRHLRTLSEARIGEIARLAQNFFGERDGATAVTIDGLVERMASPDTVLIDVRPRLEFEAAHIPGAFSIPLEELAARMAEIPADAHVVAYCRGPYCVLAAQAVVHLRKAGRDANRLDAGLAEWTSHHVAATAR